MSNEKFKVKFGLAVGDTAATIDGTTGDITSNGNASIQDVILNGGDIKSTGGVTAITVSGADAAIAGNLTVSGNDIKSSGGTVAIALSGADISTGDITLNGGDIRSTGGTVAISVSGADATIAGDLRVAGGDLTVGGSGYVYSSTGLAMTLTGNDVAVAGDLTVAGNDIKSSTATAITLSGADATIAGDLRVNGDDIKSSTGVTAITLVDNNVAIAADLIVNGNNIFGGGGGNAAIAINGEDLTVAGDLTVSGNDIKSSGGTTAITLSGANATVPGTATSVLGANINNTAVIGGAGVNATGKYPALLLSGTGLASSTVYADNTSGNQIGGMMVRDYGAQRPGGTSTTQGIAGIILEGKRGTIAGTGTSYSPLTNSACAVINFGGYQGASFTSESGVFPANIFARATETWQNDTASFTGYIVGTTLTVTAGSNVHPGLALAATGIIPGTTISGYGTGTGSTGTYTVSNSQTLFSSGTPGSFTGTGTKNAGMVIAMQAIPQGIKLNQTSRQGYFVPNWTAQSSTTINGVTAITPPTLSLTFGDSSLSSGSILTSADGLFRFNQFGVTNVNNTNTYTNISGVTNETAQFTGSVSGTVLTVTAMTSGTISVGQSLFFSGSPNLLTISSFGTGTGGVGTYNISISTIASAGTAMFSTADNPTLVNSNTMTIIGGRKSGVPGRRMPLKNGDIVGQYNTRGVNVANATGYQANTNLAGRMTVKATEDFSTTRSGSRLTFEATRAGTTPTLTEVYSGAPESTTFKSDSYTFQDGADTTTYATLTSTATTFTQPVGFPVKTAAQWNAITGVIGQQVCVSDSGGSSHPNGLMAFWDTTNTRWSYIHDNSAV